MQTDDWAVTFREVYDRAVEQYEAGTRDPSSIVSPGDIQFLDSIGCSPQELYDFVEDVCRMGDPSFETVLLITAARRDYFLVVQKGQPSEKTIAMSQLPRKEAESGGFSWLPRIIAKARAKLRGEMPPELMYGCGGDRPFLQKVNIHLADFLRFVWSAEDDDQKIVDYVKERASKPKQKNQSAPARSVAR
jgi:hypothetical protein